MHLELLVNLLDELCYYVVPLFFQSFYASLVLMSANIYPRTLICFSIKETHNFLRTKLIIHKMLVNKHTRAFKII